MRTPRASSFASRSSRVPGPCWIQASSVRPYFTPAAAPAIDGAAPELTRSVSTPAAKAVPSRRFGRENRGISGEVDTFGQLQTFGRRGFTDSSQRRFTRVAAPPLRSLHDEDRDTVRLGDARRAGL